MKQRFIISLFLLFSMLAAVLNIIAASELYSEIRLRSMRYYKPWHRLSVLAIWRDGAIK